MNGALGRALDNLRSIASQSEKVLDRLSGSSERLSKKTSATLLGTLGGLGGLTTAYLISSFEPLSLTITSVLFSSIGVVSGLLFHRGARRIALERRIEENRLAADEILLRIKQLPKNAPPEVREELWITYRSLTTGFHTETTRALTAAHGKADFTSPKFLSKSTTQDSLSVEKSLPDTEDDLDAAS